MSEIHQHRTQTRRNRYDNKLKSKTVLPLSICTINFSYDENLALLIRSAACFGVQDIFVIGSIPERKFLNPKSGSLLDYVNLINFKNPGEFLKFSRDENIKLFSAEISENAQNLYSTKFSTDRACVVLGNETTGVPVEILLNSENIYIPMHGAGFCLNTSHTGTAIISEYSRQFWLKNEL